jgi:uncharacterized membrane protein YgcG
MARLKRKIALILLIVLLVLPALGYWLWLRNYADKSIIDEAGVIKDPEPYLIEMYFLKKYSDVNFRIVTKKSLNGISIDEAADKEFARQRRWNSMNPDRAVLFFLALEEKGVRLRYGDELAPVLDTQFFDKPFVKFIQEEQMPGFFAESQPWEVLSATLNLVWMQISERFFLPSEVGLGGELPPIAKHLIQDEAGIIEQPVMILQTILQLRKNLQIDFRIVTVRTLSGKDINIEANKKFEEMRIGNDMAGKRGLLLFIAPEEQLVRLEVGYELEDIYPDGFVGYIEREQMSPYFKNSRVFLGITETAITIAMTGFEKLPGVQSASMSSPEDGSRLSGGAGAKIETRVSSKGAKPEKKFLPESIKKEFKAGNIPVETFFKFLEACRQHINDPTLDIYTKESQIFLSNEVISNIELGRIAETYTGKVFEEKIKGNRAVLKFKQYPPVFLKKGPQGWQIDLATMDRAMTFKVAPSVVFRGLSCVTHPYRFAYPDFRYKTGKQPEFLIKGIDKNGPWLGVTLGFVTSDDFEEPDVIAGGFVLEVCPGSPAEKAGLQYGDIIVRIDDWNGTYAELIPKIISSYAIGDEIYIFYYRGNNPHHTRAVLGKNQDTDYF